MFFSRKKSTYTLTSTQELLLALLRAQLWLKPVDDIVLPGGKTIDERRVIKDDSSGHDSSSLVDEIHAKWDELLDLGYKQTVICFIAAACLRHKDADKIPSDIKEELEAVIEENAKIHEHHNAILIELITKFEEQGLHPILLKGQGLAHMYDCVCDSYMDPEYPSSEIEHCTLNIVHSQNSVLRQCGDIDLYISPEEYERAKAFLISIEDEGQEHHVDNFKHYETLYKGIAVELHHHLSWNPDPFADKHFQKLTEERMKTPSSFSINEKNIHVSEPLFNLLSVFDHMWQHFESGGVSLRQLCDIAMMIHFYQKEITKEELKHQLAKLHYCLPWKTCGCIWTEQLGLPTNEFGMYDSHYRKYALSMLDITLTYGAFHQEEHSYENMSWLGTKIAMHSNLHRYCMGRYPATGIRIFWRYAYHKRNVIYKCISLICNHTR